MWHGTFKWGESFRVGRKSWQPAALGKVLLDFLDAAGLWSQASEQFLAHWLCAEDLFKSVLRLFLNIFFNPIGCMCARVCMCEYTYVCVCVCECDTYMSIGSRRSEEGFRSFEAGVTDGCEPLDVSARN